MPNVRTVLPAISNYGTYSRQNELAEQKITNVSTISRSRTPPWRKNSILNLQQKQQQQQQQQTNVVQQSHGTLAASNGRVPPLPQQSSQSQQQPPWHDETQKRRNTAKKRPNFKEDPTGYLDHQTAILHNSILNLHSPEIQETPESGSTLSTYQSQLSNANQLVHQNHQIRSHSDLSASQNVNMQVSKDISTCYIISVVNYISLLFCTQIQVILW